MMGDGDRGGSLTRSGRVFGPDALNDMAFGYRNEGFNSDSNEVLKRALVEC
jgi:hypothetical protein